MITTATYTDAAIRKVVDLHHNPNEWDKPGMVYQLWEDGEITSQKCGRLFNQRNLHCFEVGVASGRTVEMPVKSGDHSYAFMPSLEIAKAVRNMFDA